MILVKNKWFPFGNYKAINICGIVFYKGNKITSPMFTPIDVRKIYDKKIKSINSNITFWDVYVALNAQYHDNIELYKEWFGEDNIDNIKDKIIESAIVNWFEDEDAGIEKVWNYFRAI